MDIVEKARAFAVAAHSAVGQKRKYTGEPYWNHPVEVARIVSTVGGSKSMIAAAMLHDVVEDTGVPIELIYSEFGGCVAEFVAGLTDVSKPEDGNRQQRKAIDRAHTAAQSPDCQTIKLADLISNTSSIARHDPDFARVYLLEKHALLKVLVGGHPTLHESATLLLIEAAAAIGLELPQ